MADHLASTLVAYLADLSVDRKAVLMADLSAVMMVACSVDQMADQMVVLLAAL